jgi:hypothetical protein
MEILKNEAGDAVLEETVAQGNDAQNAESDPNEQMKQEYIAYVNEIRSKRFDCDTRTEAIDSINAICKVLNLTTVVPKTELQTRGDQRQPAIVGGTHIDLVKSQYPGVYPVLLERLIELTVKL